jgi:hypothetical protein
MSNFLCIFERLERRTFSSSSFKTKQSAESVVRAANAAHVLSRSSEQQEFCYSSLILIDHFNWIYFHETISN